MVDPNIVREIRRRVLEAKGKVRVGGRYYYYKSPNKFYTVVDVALLSGEEVISLADIRPMVIYKSEYPELTGTLWARPLEDFIAKVETSGRLVPRFVSV